MLWTILRREIQDGFAGFTFLTALVLITILAPLSAGAQALYYKQVLEDYAARQKIHTVEMANEAVVLTRSVPAMLPFCNGVYENLPDEVILRGDSVSQNPSTEDVGPLNWLFPDTDLSLIVGVLLTLLAILLSHDAFTGEKEKGTLKMILATAVPRSKVLMAKLLGTSFLMTLSLIYAVLLYSAVLAVVSGGAYHFSSSTLILIAVFTLVSLLTITVFIALGIAISTTVKSSSASLGLCMAAWVLMVLIWPSLGPYTATSFWPVASRQSEQRRVFQKESELIQSELAEHRQNAEKLAAAKVDVQTAWRQYLELQRRLIKQRKEEVGQLIRERQAQVARQKSIMRRFLSLSAYEVFKSTLSDVCGTGVKDYENFVAEAERYYQGEFIPAIFKSRAEEKPWLGTATGPVSLDMRPFSEPDITLGKRLKGATLPMTLLAVETCLLIGIGLWQFKRYDVR